MRAALRYAAIGLAVFWVVYYRRIPFSSLLMEYYDNVYHYNNIRAIAESGDFSILHALPFYATPADVRIAPWPVHGGFYPYGWHFVCALVLQLSSSSMALVTNSVNYLLCGMVFPLSMALLNDAISPNDPYARLAGSLIATALTGFPWTLFLLWPLYPNSLGLALAPATAGLFVIGIRDVAGMKKVPYALAFALSLVGAAAGHPNTVFTLLVLLFPFLGGRILAGSGLRYGRLRISKYLLAVLYCLAFASCWMYLYYSPAFRGVVSFNWGTDIGLVDGVHDVLSLGYMYHLDMDEPHYLCALLAFVGCISCLRRRNGRWTIGSYALASFIVFGELVLSSENPLKHILAGFWYTDPYRIAASATICVLPLVTFGLAECLRRFDRVLAQSSKADAVSSRRNLAMGAVCTALVVGIYLPQLPFLASRGIRTSFGNYRMLADIVSTRKDVLDNRELAFLAEAAKILPDDAVVINCPYDGSNFAYGALGTRVLYRPISGYAQYPDEESAVSRLVRTNLHNLAVDTELRDALETLGDCYVLRLESTFDPDENGNCFYLGEVFPYDMWSELLSVTDDTPGLTVVLADGDLRLYHIDL